MRGKEFEEFLKERGFDVVLTPEGRKKL